MADAEFKFDESTMVAPNGRQPFGKMNASVDFAAETEKTIEVAHRHFMGLLMVDSTLDQTLSVTIERADGFTYASSLNLPRLTDIVAGDGSPQPAGSKVPQDIAKPIFVYEGDIIRLTASSAATGTVALEGRGFQENVAQPKN